MPYDHQNLPEARIESKNQSIIEKVIIGFIGGKKTHHDKPIHSSHFATLRI